jgi:hypothetical protein
MPHKFAVFEVPGLLLSSFSYVLDLKFRRVWVMVKPFVCG